MENKQKLSVFKCTLYSGDPFLAERDGKYHIIQGDMKEDEIQIWHGTPEEAVKRWNDRLYMSKLCGEPVQIAM